MSEKLLDFTEKVVLITGGKSGIGQAAAIAFAHQGANVIIVGRSNADETVNKIKEFSSDVCFMPGDVSKAAEVSRIINTIIEKYGRLDVAFNNSGLLPITTDLAEQTEADFDKIINVDLKGVFLCMKYEITQMLKQKGGAIINCSSVAGLIADPGMSPYVAAKHGVAGLTKAAGIEYAKHNIRINAIAPGLTRTKMTAGWLDSPVMSEVVKNANALNRAAEPEEIASLVLFLASPMASFIAGVVYPVDAGQTAH